MKPASAALLAYLNGLGPSSPALFADLVTFALADGSAYRFSMAQYALLAVPKNSFQGPDGSGNGASINYAASGTFDFPLGPAFSRVKTSLKLGFDPDKAQLTVIPHPPGSAAPDLIGTLSWQAAAAAGFFGGATVEVDRLFMPSLGDYSLGSFVLHLGRAGQIKIGRSRLDFEVPNLLVLLSGQYPRRLFDSGCTWVFGDANCTFNRASLAQSVTAQAGSSASDVLVASLTGASQYPFGTMTGTSGANSGVSRTIASVSGGSPGEVQVSIAFPFAPAAGDTFQLLPGCDHTIGTCQGYGNFANFGGFPYIPPPEAAV